MILKSISKPILKLAPILLCLATLFLHGQANSAEIELKVEINGAPLVNPGPIVAHIEAVAGEPLGMVREVIQGQAGFIWLATNSGLLRYDGHQIKRFSDLDDVHKYNLSSLVQDAQGIIWLGTYGGGLGRFSPATEQFDHFVSVDNDPATLDSNFINTVTLASDQQLWIGTENGLNQFDPETSTNTRLNSQFGFSEATDITLVFEDKQQRLWFSSEYEGLHLCDFKKQEHHYFRHHHGDNTGLSDDAVHTVYERRDGTIVVGTGAGADQFNPETLTFSAIETPFMLSNRKKANIVTSFKEDGAGRLWIGSHYNGLSVLHPGATTAVNINSGLSGKNTFNGQYISGMAVDASETLWVATLNGIFRMSLDHTQFEHLQMAYISPLEMTVTYVDDQGTFWLGTTDELFVFNGQQFELVGRDIGHIVAIVRDSDETLILNVQDKGIFSFNINTQQLLPYGWDGEHQPTLPANSLTSLAIDSQGTVWVGLEPDSNNISGLFSFDAENHRYVQHRDSISVNNILPLSPKSEQKYGQKILVGTLDAGLKVLEKTTGQLSDITTDSDHNINMILSLFEDKQGRVWVGTKQSGLAQLDMDSGKLTFYLNELPFLERVIKSISQDNNGNLWFGTLSGILRFNPQNHQYRHFDRDQGLRIEDIGHNMSATTASGDIVVGSATSLARFSPQLLAANKVSNTLPILLSNFRLFDKLAGLSANDPNSPLSTPLNNTDELTLSYDQYRFSFSFASSDYQSPASTRYRYKMHRRESQSNWIDRNASNREAAFTSLHAGAYLFSVNASNADGSWSDNVRQLTINIAPPWWATTTAYVLYALAAILGGFLLNTMRVRQLEQRAHKLEKGIEERTIALQQRTDTITKLLADKDQLFANISHEFRTPLTLILGPLDASLKVIQDDKLHSLMTLARTNAQRLLAMVDQLLDISRLQDFKPQEARPKNVLDVCQFLLDSYHSLADEKHIVLNMDNRLTTAVYVDMLPDALEKILSNLLTNAFKYSDGEQVINLKLSADQQWVKVDVSDTGLGISEENQHNIFDRFTRVENTLEYIPGAGIGLALVRELIEQHGGTISVESEPGVGSTFSVVLPLAANQAVDESDSKVPVVVNKGLVLSSVEQIKHDQLPDESPILITDDEIIAVIDTDRPSLLVIEDNYDMRHYITSCLVDTFDVTVAVDGEQGVEKARELLPDLVISDVMMPKMDGFEVTKALKTDLMTNHIPIILLTAHGDRESRLKGWGEKVDEYLEKPFNTTELLMRIDNLLAIRGLLRQRYQREFAESSTAQGALPAPDKALAEEQQVEEPVNQVHQAFLNKINQVLAAKYTDEKFNLAMFADEMALSSRQLSRKMKALLDMSPVESIRSYRLKKAAELLSSGVSPSVVAHEVGFTSHSYFSQCFKAQYQCMPSSFTGKPISEEEEA